MSSKYWGKSDFRSKIVWNWYKPVNCVIDPCSIRLGWNNSTSFIINEKVLRLLKLSDILIRIYKHNPLSEKGKLMWLFWRHYFFSSFELNDKLVFSIESGSLYTRDNCPYVKSVTNCPGDNISQETRDLLRTLLLIGFAYYAYRIRDNCYGYAICHIVSSLI